MKKKIANKQKKKLKPYEISANEGKKNLNETKKEIIKKSNVVDQSVQFSR